MRCHLLVDEAYQVVAVHDVVSVAIAEDSFYVGGTAAEDVPYLADGVVGDTAADAPAVREDVDSITAFELAGDGNDTGGEKTGAAVEQCVTGARVDRDRGAGTPSGKDPALPSLERVVAREETSAKALAGQGACDDVIFVAIDDPDLGAGGGRDTRRGNFGSHASGTDGRTGAAGVGFDLGSDGRHLGHEASVGIERRVGRKEARQVGDQQQDIGVDQAGDQG